MQARGTYSTPNETAGVFYAAGAYVLWGVLPLYWFYLGDVPPVELSFHRMVWCALFGLGALAVSGKFHSFVHVFRTPHTLGALTISSLLIGANWTIFIYAIASKQLVEASLGSYITPLLSILLGVVVLGERLSLFRIVAIVLAVVAVSLKAFAVGHVPWIALSLVVSFGFYGFVRKLTPVPAMTGLTVETVLLLPITAGGLIYWGITGTGAFNGDHIVRDVLLIVGGPITALPLALFAAGARRIRLSTLGFLHYLAPSISLVVAVLVMGEHFTIIDVATFGCVWVALGLIVLESHFGSRILQNDARVIADPGDVETRAMEDAQ